MDSVKHFMRGMRDERFTDKETCCLKKVDAEAQLTEEKRQQRK